jgi:transcriptional regulator with XRE-family HTH domain
MLRDPVLESYRLAQANYRMAIALELKNRRNAAGMSISELAMACRIPAETLRSYERGSLIPQLPRLAAISSTYTMSPIRILLATAEYLYTASGTPQPQAASSEPSIRRALLLYCGVLPEHLNHYECFFPWSGELAPGEPSTPRTVR